MMTVESTQESCGWAVPEMELKAERQTLRKYLRQRGAGRADGKIPRARQQHRWPAGALPDRAALQLMPLITLETVFSPIEAEIMRTRLEAGGIEAVLFDAGIASLIGPGLSGVRLMVLDEDEAAARALLSA